MFSYVRASTLRPLIFPTEVRVRSPVPPVIPLRSSTSQAKNVIAMTTRRGLAALRKACIMAVSGLQQWVFGTGEA